MKPPMPSLTPRQLARIAYRRLPALGPITMDALQRRRHSERREPAHLNVMTSLGGNDADVLQVMLLSLVQSHPGDQIDFWLFHLSLSQDKLDGLATFCDGLPNLTLHVITVQERKDFATLSQLGNRPFGARFLWYIAHEYLPATMQRIVYIDPLDTLVTGDLLPFATQPLLGHYIAACRESPTTPPILCKPALRTDGRALPDAKVLRISKGVFNSGVMVIDLARLRRDKIGMDAYLQTGLLAQERGLGFGDQGLYSLTHGSNYLRAHDRYNYRFHDFPRGFAPVVVHFAGRIAKPFHLKLSGDQEQQILDHLAQTGDRALRLNPHQTIKAGDLPFYRHWWQVCAQTPVHDRIAPIAAEYATHVLAQPRLPLVQPPQPMRSLA